MCLINSMLHPYLYKFVVVFIDDILIYSKNEEEHAKHLETLLRLLGENHLYAKLSKCIFFQIEVHYLGQVLSKEGITVAPKRIRVIMKWATPKNVDEMRSFTGLGGYYRRFMKKFSCTEYLMTSLHKKVKKFEWTKECVASFEQLK